MKVENIKFDCKHFKGAIPCKPNKLRGKICECDEYMPISKRILIIKLGAMGDVIRTTPLIERFRKLYPGCHISWITWTPDILPDNFIEEVYPFDFTSTYIIRNQKFDIAINLDKEYEACALLKDVEAQEKYGFILKNDHIDIATKAAEHKLLTGLFDQLSKENKKSYLEEIFEICHLNFQGEEYVLAVNEGLFEKWNVLREKAGDKKIIGLNTGAGKRWPTRLWPPEYWIKLINNLQDADFFPMVLGGPDEDEQNKIYEKETGVYYPGTFSLKEFIALTANCDLVVSAVSMMMHIAIGLKKPLILFNNIFNRYEFELYGRGEIVEPFSGCDDFYGQVCSRERHCMNDLSVEKVFDAIQRNILTKV